MNRNQLIQSVGDTIIHHVTTGDMKSKQITVQESRQILDITATAPSAGFSFAQELCTYVEYKMLGQGFQHDKIVNGCMEALGTMVILLSTQIATDNMKKLIESGDTTAIQKFTEDIINELMPTESKNAEPEIDEATKDSLFSGLDFDMKWKDNLN